MTFVLQTLIVALLGATVAACAPAGPASSSSAAVTAGDQSVPIPLPDLTGVAPSVQAQIRQRDAAVRKVLARPQRSRSEQAAAFGELGRVLMAARFNAEAATCFARAESLEPGEMRWPYYLGHVSLRRGDRMQAAGAFERALNVRANDLTTLVWLGETYLDDDRLEQAQAAFARALAVQPQSAPALFGAGRVALARKQYADAAQLLERALTADSRASAVQYPLAMAYRALGDGQKADQHLRQRGSTYPALSDPLMADDAELLDSPVALENRGMEALRAGDFASAIPVFRKGLTLAPEDTSLRYWLGAALYASGDVDGAVREFSDVLRRAPDHARAHFSLGAIYEARNDKPRALAEYQSAVRADPGLPDARLRLAEEFRGIGNADLSVEQYEAAVKLDPTMIDAWIGGARALIELKRSERARAWLSEARRLFPNRPELAELESHVNKKSS